MPAPAPNALPLDVCVAFTHAVVQFMADDVSVDLLHIKGPALDPTLLVNPDGEPARKRHSFDADVWVRPAHADSLLAAMQEHGWSVFAPFKWGASFEHAATLTRPGYVSVDVHRTFPGVTTGIAETFDALWAERRTMRIAGIECQVPSLRAQRLILLLHTARNGPGRADVPGAWGSADEPAREAVWALARDFGAEVPVAAAVGELDRFAERREHDMWAYLSTGTGTWAQQWWARMRAERNPLVAVGRGFRMAFPSREGMEHRAGHRLGRIDLARAYLARFFGGFRPTGGKARQAGRRSS